MTRPEPHTKVQNYLLMLWKITTYFSKNIYRERIMTPDCHDGQQVHVHQINILPFALEPFSELLPFPTGLLELSQMLSV